MNFPPRGIGMKTMDKCVSQSELDKIELFEVLKNLSPKKLIEQRMKKYSNMGIYST